VSYTLGGAPQKDGPYKGYSWVAQGVPMLPATTTIDGKPIAKGKEFDVIMPGAEIRMRVTSIGHLDDFGFPAYREAYPDRINRTRYVVVANLGTSYQTTYVFEGPSDDWSKWRDAALNHFAKECIATQAVYLPATTLGAALDPDHLGKVLQSPHVRSGPTLVTTTRIGDTKTEVSYLTQTIIEESQLPQGLRYGYYILLAMQVSLIDEVVAARGLPDNRAVVHLSALFLDVSIGVYRPIPIDTATDAVPTIVALDNPHEMPTGDLKAKLQSVIAALMAPTIKV
jgi:hypothetical protein